VALVVGLLLLVAVLWLGTKLAGVLGDDGGGGEDAEWGRWNTLGRNHPSRHLVTPAPGRRGWRR
jgi:hypothetical protein